MVPSAVLARPPERSGHVLTVLSLTPLPGTSRGGFWLLKDPFSLQLRHWLMV